MEVFDAFDNDSISGNHQLGYLKIFRWPDYHVHALPGQIWVLPTRNKTKLLKFVEVFLQYFHHSLIPIPNRIMKREILSNSFLFRNTIYVRNFVYIVPAIAMTTLSYTLMSSKVFDFYRDIRLPFSIYIFCNWIAAF